MKKSLVFQEYRAAYGIVFASFILIYKYFRRCITNLYINHLHINGKLGRHIVFESIPDYSDNARALSEYLVANYSNQYKIYWLVYDVKQCKKKYGEKGITFIPRFNGRFKEFPLESVKLYMTAKYIMATHEFAIPKSKSVKGQYYVRLWHGCGYKDNENKIDGNNLFDIHCVPGNIFVDTKSFFWNASKDHFLPLGLPRYDWLLQPKDDALVMKMKYCQNDEKLILWMPTFRNPKRGFHVESSITQFPLIDNNESWIDLDKKCIENNITLIIKLHPFQKDYPIPFDKFKNIYEIRNSDFDQYGISMYEFIATTDALISDYSSVAIDYLLVNKPIAFALDDFVLYQNTRGFVFDNPKEFMPGHHLYTKTDLYDFINDVSLGVDKYKDNRKLVSSKAVHISSNYCEEIWNNIKAK